MSLVYPRTWIEISRSAFAHNVQALARLCAPSELGLVVKSNAYGHGLAQIVSLAEQYVEVTWLFTAGLDEALQARMAGSTKSILAMAYLDGDLQAAVREHIGCVLYSVEQLPELEQAGRAVGRRVRVHMKIDTGMTRLGFSPAEALACAQVLIQYPQVELVGVFTHLADVNNPEQVFTLQQLVLFDEVVAALAHQGFSVPWVHAISSGALVLARHAPQMYTVVRVGTNVYGNWKSPIQQYLLAAHDPSFSLQPIATWKSRIMHLRVASARTTVGYTRLYTTNRDTVIGLVPIGYWDGYPRALSHRAQALVHDVAVPVVGVVSMNFITLDLTDVPDAQVGTPVTLLGGDGVVSATTLATAAGTINNELLTRIPNDIPRVIVE